MDYQYKIIFLSGLQPFTLSFSHNYYKHNDVIEIHHPEMLMFKFSNSKLRRFLYFLTKLSIFKPIFVEYISDEYQIFTK